MSLVFAKQTAAVGGDKRNALQTLLSAVSTSIATDRACRRVVFKCSSLHENVGSDFFFLGDHLWRCRAHQMVICAVRLSGEQEIPLSPWQRQAPASEWRQSSPQASQQ